MYIYMRENFTIMHVLEHFKLIDSIESIDLELVNDFNN